MRRRPGLSEEVAGHLRHLIMSGAIRPGQFIRMDETAVELEVSVTPVREALLILRGEGMVNLVPHRGYVVADLTRQDVADIFWLQSVLAVELAVRTASTITSAELDRLAELNEALQDALAAAEYPRSCRPSSSSIGCTTESPTATSWRGSCSTPPGTPRKSSTRTTHSGGRSPTTVTSSSSTRTGVATATRLSNRLAGSSPTVPSG